MGRRWAGVTKMDLSTLPFPVDWLEDETLHGICVRHVLLAGRHSLRNTVKALFTTRTGKIDCHFQDHLDTFVAQTNGLLGNCDEIIRNHTVLPSFTRFMDPERAEAIVAALRAPRRSESASKILRDRAHPYPKQRHLRMCNQCVADDERRRGFAHWRRTHQLPGVYRCPTHHAPLRQIWIGDEASGTWLHLPVGDADNRWQTTLPIDEGGNDVESALHQIAAVAREIVLMPPGSRLRPTILAELYRAKLDDRGLMVGRRVLRGQADLDLLQFAGALNDLPHARHWLSDSIGKALITRMVSPTPVFPWPVLHTIFIAWLFTSWEDFLVAYKAQLDAPTDGYPRESTPPALSKPPKVKSLVTAARKATFEALLGKGLTRNAAAKQAGVSTAAERAWAAAAGVAVGPWKTSLAVREDLERLLKEGFTYPAIAKALEISAHTVGDFLAVNPVIKQSRRQAVMQMKAARRQRGLAIARVSWAEALQRSRRGDVGATLLVAKDGHFFREYDPRGYEKMMAAFPPAFSKRRRLPDLHSKDQLLATAITQVADELRAGDRSCAVNTWNIVHVLEARGLLETDCERLLMPLAKRALRQALKKR